MRLINVKNKNLEDFTGRSPPEYAILSHTWSTPKYDILSHTWGTEEITFSEMQSQQPDKDKAGWKKIELSCKQAEDDGHGYVWCDTCCIDKSSSAELSESINSMFRWYQEAEVCYAFLEDISDVKDLGKAKWFTRGWTLQELIAPKSLVFYVEDDNAAWRKIGIREEVATANQIAGITGIDEYFLRGVDSTSRVHGASFAKRVAWASNRTTTRHEDIAYCLMGLLDVNMPLLYGEGGVKAFRRLQEEYLKVNPDQSFLAWLRPEDGEPNTSDGNLFAAHPKYFQKCNKISLASDDAAAFTLNNKGLQIRLPLFQNRSDNAIRSPEYFAILACYSDAQPGYRIRIPLRAVERSAESFTLFPGREHVPDLPDEFDDAHMTNCVVLRTLPPLTPRLLSVNSLPELISWKPKIIYLNPSTGTWDCLSEPADLDPNILRPELNSQYPSIRMPDQREWASYGVLLHPPSPYSDNTSSDCENISCLKVLIRVDVRFERRYEVNVRIQLFHIAGNEILTDSEDLLSVSSTEPPSNSRSRIIYIPTQPSETIHASASWKRISSQDVLSVKIDLASVDRHRAHQLYALSISAFNLIITKDPRVHALYGTIAMLVLITFGQPNAFSFEALGLGLAVTSVYFITLPAVRFMVYIRPEYRVVYFRLPFAMAFLLLSKQNFVDYNDVPSARYYGALHWALATLSVYHVLMTFVGRMGYKSPHEEQMYVQELDPSTGLEHLLLDDTI